MHTPACRCCVVLMMFFLPLILNAQTSANYRVEEYSINHGGDPDDGAYPMSADMQITLDALGDGLPATILSSASYTMSGGMVPVFPPPGEVLNLLFSDKSTLAWNPERSAGTYNVYRGLVSDLGSQTGACLHSGLISTTGTDSQTPPPGQVYFYLVTAENRLLEEGTKGFDSSGGQRQNPSPCP